MPFFGAPASFFGFRVFSLEEKRNATPFSFTSFHHQLGLVGLSVRGCMMKTTCEMVMESLTKMKQHLYQAHNMQPDFHITVTNECRMELLDDPEALRYIHGYDGNCGRLTKICDYGFSIVEDQEQPYRIWIAGKLH